MVRNAIAVAILVLSTYVHGQGMGPQGTIQCGQVVSGDTTTGSHGLGQSSLEHSYLLTVTQAITVTIDACNSTYDVYLHIYNQDMSTALVSRDDGGCPRGISGLRSRIIGYVLQPGTYNVIVEGYGANVGPYTLGVTCTPYQSPYQGPITCGSNATGSTFGFPQSLGPLGADNTYNLTVTNEIIATIGTCNGTDDTRLSLYNSANLARPIQYVDNGGCSSTALSQITALLSPGTYTILVEGGRYDEIGVNYSLDVSCDVPQPLSSLSCNSTVVGNTGTGSHQHGGSSLEHIYPFNVTETTAVTLDACNASYDVYLRIFNSDMSQQLIARDDGGCGTGISGLRSRINGFVLEPGSYNALIEGYGTNTGSYSLGLTCTPDPEPHQDIIECGETFSGSTYASSSQLGLGGTEHIYNFTLTNETTLVSFDACESDGDTRLFVYNQSNTERFLSYVDNGGCPTGYPSDRSLLTAVLPAGSYMAVVEGGRYAEDEVNYTLTMSCETPQPLPALTCNSSVSGNTGTGSHQHGGLSLEHIYPFNVTETTAVTLDGCNASYDIYLRIFNGDMSQQIAYRDDGGCGTGVSGVRSRINGYVLPAGSYNALVEGYSTRTGQYELGLSCYPATDPNQGQIGCGETVSGSTLNQSNEVGTRGPEHQYNFTLGSADRVTFDSCASGINTRLTLYTSAGLTRGLAETGCSSGSAARLTASLPAGDYYVVIEGSGTDEIGGDYSLGMTCVAGTTGAPVTSGTSGTSSTSGTSRSSTMTVSTSVSDLSSTMTVSTSSLPTNRPTPQPSFHPTPSPSNSPSPPTPPPTQSPTPMPTSMPTGSPTARPCYGCNPGSYAAPGSCIQRQSECTQCGPGEYQDETGMRSCKLQPTCPSGSERVPLSSLTEEVSCLVCRPGYIDDDSDGSTPCVLTTAPTSVPSPIPTPAPNPGGPQAINSNDSSSDSTTMIIVIVIAVALVILVAVGATAYYMKSSKSADAASRAQQAFDNPIYASGTPGDATFEGEPDYTEPDTLGYLDIPASGDSSGYMDVPAAEEATGYMDVPAESDDEDV